MHTGEFRRKILLLITTKSKGYVREAAQVEQYLSHLFPEHAKTVFLEFFETLEVTKTMFTISLAIYDRAQQFL